MGGGRGSTFGSGEPDNDEFMPPGMEGQNGDDLDRGIRFPGQGGMAMPGMGMGGFGSGPRGGRGGLGGGGTFGGGFGRGTFGGGFVSPDTAPEWCY